MTAFSWTVGISLFMLFIFLLYCCVRVSAVSNKVVEQLKENQKQMDTDAENQDELSKEAGFQIRNDHKSSLKMHIFYRTGHNKQVKNFLVMPCLCVYSLS